MKNPEATPEVQQRSTRWALTIGAVAGVGLTSLWFFSANSRAEYIPRHIAAMQDMPEGYTWPDDYLTLPQPIPDNDPANTCTTNLPNYGVVFDNSTEALSNIPDVGEHLSATQTQHIVELIAQDYNIPIVFQTQGNPQGDTLRFGALDKADKRSYVPELSDLLHVLESFDPDVIKALALTQLVFVNDLQIKQGDVWQEVGGMYRHGSEGNLAEIYVSSNGTDDLKQRITHELTHAIATQLLCGDQDNGIEKAFEYVSQDEYGHADPTNQADIFEFASLYGATNPKEDIAELLSYTLEMRGLIRPGDPEWGSPLHLKQQELVRRLDKMMPGYVEYLAQHIELLR